MDWSIPPGVNPALFTHELTVSTDTFVNVEAVGSTIIPHWIAGDYLANEAAPTGSVPCPNAAGALGMLPFSVTNPVFIDADQDGLIHMKAVD